MNKGEQFPGHVTPTEGPEDNTPYWVLEKDSQLATAARDAAIVKRLNEYYEKLEDDLAILPRWLRRLIKTSPSALGMALAGVLATADQVDEPSMPSPEPSRHEQVLSPQDIAEFRPPGSHLYVIETSGPRGLESSATFNELVGLTVSAQTRKLLQLPSRTIAKDTPLNFDTMLQKNLAYRLYEFEERKKAREQQSNPDLWDSMVSLAMESINLLTPEAERRLQESGYDRDLDTFRHHLNDSEAVQSIQALEQRLARSIEQALLAFDKEKEWQKFQARYSLSDEDLSTIQEIIRGVTPAMLVDEFKQNLFGSESAETQDRLLNFILKQQGGFAFLLALPPEQGTVHGSRVLSLLQLTDEHPPVPDELQNCDRLVRKHLEGTMDWLGNARRITPLTPPESVAPSNPSQQ